jgi:hypothetical protein
MMGCLKPLTPNTKSDKRWFISVRESRRTWFSFATFGCGKDATPQRRTYGRRCKRMSALFLILLLSCCAAPPCLPAPQNQECRP